VASAFFRRTIVGAALSLVVASTAVSAQKTDKSAKADETGRPRFSLKAQPASGIAPARVVLMAELTGGANDFAEYYCPTIRWEWDDGTSSESASDCEPYEAGKTEIKRRFTVEHRFDRAGTYKVYVRLKQRDKDVVASSVTIQIHPGVNDIDR
jgi:hypothetical protein